MWFQKKPKRIYLDHAGASPVLPHIEKVMRPYFGEAFYNPSALYQEALQVHQALDIFRSKSARAIHAQAKEIIFTGSGTEADNLALVGSIEAYRKANPGGTPEILVSSIEHKAVLETARALVSRGLATVSYIPVDEYGVIDLKEFRSLLSSRTAVVSVMMVNNEIGTIQPITECAREIRHFKKHDLKDPNATYPVLHTDAIQAPHILDIDVRKLGADLVTLSSAKIGGPKGVGMLYVRQDVAIEPGIFGGGQERGMRAGTENMALIAGYTEALVHATVEREKSFERFKKLQESFVSSIQDLSVDLEELFEETSGLITLLGSDTSRAPHIVSVAVRGISGEEIVIMMDAAGIAVSSQSACSVGRDEESHVMQALGKNTIDGMVRFSFGYNTTRRELDKALETFDAVLRVILSTKKRFA